MGSLPLEGIMRSCSRVVSIGIAAGLVFIAATTARSATTAYESFNYNNGATLDGQLGGDGFTGSWSGNSLFTIASGSLIDPTGMNGSAGNRVTSGASDANKDIHRDLTVPVGTPGT